MLPECAVAVPVNPNFCALINENGRRIEFHLAQVENLIYMVALSGRFGQPASRQKAQGPFLTKAEAADNMRAISNTLVHTGYEQLIGVKPYWHFQVLGELRRVKRAQANFTCPYTLHPDYPYFD